jgi:putative Ca2+/H+ antiporter (TMEM165/GDT1 family)
MFDDILIPFITIGLAELGDKTQISILLLSSRTRTHLSLLFGVMLAFLLTDGVAILAGRWITDVAPQDLIKTASGIIFILFGIFFLKGRDVEEEGTTHRFRGPFYSGFTLTFLAEWGDKTQIASGLFATRYNAVMVLMGVMMALLSLSIVAIYLGRFLQDRLNERVVTRLSGVIFILIGLSFLLFNLRG